MAIHNVCRRFVELCRGSRGTIELRSQRFRLADAVEQAIEMVQPLTEARGIRLDVEFDPGDAVFIEGDLTRLVQVFVNLLTNAAKFTGPGGTITVVAVREGNQTRVHVRDTGSGIAPALLPEIFELFVQGRNELDRSEDDLGIGLTSSARLCICMAAPFHPVVVLLSATQPIAGDYDEQLHAPFSADESNRALFRLTSSLRSA